MSGFRDKAFYNVIFDQGYWSPSTASANFCEQDYAVSFYVGEFISTLTNLAYIYFALYPPTLRLLPTQSQRKSERHVIWDVHTLALISVGLCSGFFHLTLRRLPQFFDESSMYFLAAGFTYDLLTTRYSIDKNARPNVKRVYGFSTAAAIVSIILTTSTITLFTGDLIIHSITFGIALVISGVRLVRLIRQHDPAERSKFYRHLFSADMTLNLAFALWLVDCSPAYCAHLRGVREALVRWCPPGVGLVLGFFTELHGWWHVLTARAAGEFISLIRYLTSNAPNQRSGSQGSKFPEPEDKKAM